MVQLSANQEPLVLSRDTRKYNGIDLMKFLCAIMVYTVHFPPFQGEVTGIYQYINFGLRQYICRLAVPFYFISSGFFLFKKMPLYQPDKNMIKTYCFKLLRLFGTWSLLLVLGGKEHLWYLGATVIAVILLSLLLHLHIKLKYLYAIGLAFYAVGLLGDSYYGMIAPLKDIAFFAFLFKGYAFFFSTTRNGVFMGFIYVLMGATFANYHFKIKPGAAFVGLTVSMLFLFAEVFLLKYNNIPSGYNMYVFLLPATFFLFQFAYSLDLKNHPVYRHLRNIGIFVYFSHSMMDQITWAGVCIIYKYWDSPLYHYQYLIALTAALLAGILADMFSHKHKFHWIHYLFS